MKWRSREVIPWSCARERRGRGGEGGEGGRGREKMNGKKIEKFVG